MAAAAVLVERHRQAADPTARRCEERGEAGSEIVPRPYVEKDGKQRCWRLQRAALARKFLAHVPVESCVNDVEPRLIFRRFVM